MSDPVTSSLRIGRRPHESLDRTNPVVFSFNGGTVAGLTGDTIASALLAAGIRQIGQGRRLGRHRGILTADRFDPNCLVEVDGSADVAGAHHLIEEGIRVRSRSVRAAPASGLLNLDNRLRALVNPEAVLRPHSAPIAGALRRLAARTRARTTARRPSSGRARHVHTDVLVIGGGAAGLAAAVGATSAGAEVTLIEADRRLGGWASLDVAGAPVVEALEAAARRSGTEFIVDAVALCGTADDTVLVAAGEELIVVHAAHVVGAFGLHERMLTFTGNDLPGVMTATAGHRLTQRWGVLPGHSAMMLTANDHGLTAAEHLVDAGLALRELVDTRSGLRIDRAEGGDRLERVVLNDGRQLDVDSLLVAPGWTVDAALARSLGGTVSLDMVTGAVSVVGSSGRLSVTGAMVQLGPLEDLVALADVAGRQAAAAAARYRSSGDRPRRATPPAPIMAPVPLDDLPEVLSVGVVDFAEDLTQFDLGSGSTGWRELLVAAAAPSSGPLARAELADLARSRAGVTDLALPLLTGTLGGTTALPTGVSLGALAALHHRVVAETPLRAEHEALGAALDDVCGWYRPLDYGDTVDERSAAASTVVVHDTGCDGLLQLRGPDVHRLITELGCQLGSVGSCNVERLACAERPVVVIRPEDDCWWLRSSSDDSAHVEAAVSTLIHLDHRDWAVHANPMGDSVVGIAIVGPRALDLGELVCGVRPEPGSVVAVSGVGVSQVGVRPVGASTVGTSQGAEVWLLHFPHEVDRTDRPPVLEVRVSAASAVGMWRELLSQGRPMGVRPAGVRAMSGLFGTSGVLASV